MIPRLGVLSLEPWDDVWRRNQHLVAELVRQRLVGEVLFVAPPAKLRHTPAFSPMPGVQVRTPHLLLPQQRGGQRIVTAEVRAMTRRLDLLWINDAVLGVGCLRAGQPAVYDVTDDWREADLAPAHATALVAAEDGLAGRADTVVCSQVLADRWTSRYAVTPPVVQNGVALDAHDGVTPTALAGQGPHALYVGTLHHERLDIGLLVDLAGSSALGQIDLVGPDSLDDRARTALLETDKIRLHGPVSHADVPALMAGADVLLCPHLVDSFTLSLDAIKSFEYLATSRPVVATPSSGFQHLVGTPGLTVVDRQAFPAAVADALQGDEAWVGRADGAGWNLRAQQFAAILSRAVPRA